MSDIFVPGLPLGRLFSPDARDAQFRMAPPPLQAIEARYKYWTTGPILDQGYTSQCVAYSTEQFLKTSPIRNNYYKTPTELYNECQLIDEWPGENYEGTSVRAAMKVLKREGRISQYNWAFDLETMIRHILAVGPVIVGTNWYLGMSAPDRHGFVYPNGPVIGGHAYLASGANRYKKCPTGALGAIQFTNSWGTAWGVKGRFWMSFADFTRLIAEDGEVATAIEIKV